MKYVSRASLRALDFRFDDGEVVRLYSHDTEKGMAHEEVIRRVLRVMNEVNEAISIARSHQAEHGTREDGTFY